MKTRKFTKEEIAKWDQEQIRMEQALDGYSVWKIIERTVQEKESLLVTIYILLSHPLTHPMLVQAVYFQYFVTVP